MIFIDKTIFEQSQFKNHVFQRQRNTFNIAYLPMLYPLAFFISFVFSILLDLHDYIIALIFIVFTVFAVIYNFCVLKQVNLHNTLQEYYYKLLLSAFSQRTFAFAFINNKGNIIYSDETTRNLIKLSQNNNYELEKLLLVLNISPLNSQKIRDFISRAAVYSSFTEKDQINQLIIPDVLVFNNKCLLYLDLIDPQNVISCISLVKEETHPEFNFIDQLNIGFYETDVGGKIEKVNDNFAKMLGYQSDELVNSRVSIQSLINDKEYNNTIKKCMSYNWQGFISLKTKHNETSNFFINNKSLLNYSNSSYTDKIIGSIIKIKDSSLVIKSQQLEQSWIDFSWQYFFEKSPYAACLTDIEGKITKTNPSFVKCLTNNVIDKHLAELFNENDSKLIINYMKDLIIDAKAPQSIIVKFLKNDYKILDVYISKIIDSDNNLNGFIVRISDITHQKQLEENFSHSQRMQTIGHLVGAVAHDFNNILTAISGFCDLLLMRHGIGDPSFSDIMQIKQSADRASNLVQRLLAFSRKQTLKLQPVNPAELFSDSYPLIQRLIGSSIKFSQKISPDVWKIKVDPVQMQQVILNLVVNAHQAMPDGGTLTINVQNYILSSIKDQLRGYSEPADEEIPNKGSYVEITVEDTGDGIPKEIIQKIFEPFFTTKSDKTGTGFGLSTVYGVVRQSGGFVYVKSKIGKGTKFTLLFRKYNEEEAKDDMTLKQLLPEKPLRELKTLENKLSGHGKIVLVEDEEAIRIFAKNVLTSKGYEVIEFSSAKEASEELPKIINTIDLIITDVVMPEMSGPDFISQIRKIRPSIKVIFISGYAEEVFTEEYGKNRDFHFVPKPFSLKQLLAKIKEVMDG